MTILELLGKQNPISDRWLAYRETDLQLRQQLFQAVHTAFETALDAAEDAGLEDLLNDMNATYAEVRGRLDFLICGGPLPVPAEPAVPQPPSCPNGASHPVLGSAWQALDFIEENEPHLCNEERRNCLSAVAALQKINFRNLSSSDSFQDCLFRRLRGLSANLVLPALRHGISAGELVEIAETLPEAVGAAQLAVEERRMRAAVQVPRSGKAGRHNRGAHRNVPAIPVEIQAAGEITEGRRMLLVGGICKEEDRARIERALACEVNWLDARKGEDLSVLATAAGKCDLMVAIIRLASHGHTRGMTELSRKTGIPLVRVTAGFSPVAIAQAICQQLVRSDP